MELIIAIKQFKVPLKTTFLDFIVVTERSI
jgi:hypothetical protein